MLYLPFSTCMIHLQVYPTFSSPSLLISRSMLLHHKCKQPQWTSSRLKCGSELFQSVLKFSEISMVCGNVGDSNITDSLTESAKYTITRTLCLAKCRRHCVVTHRCLKIYLVYFDCDHNRLHANLRSNYRVFLNFRKQKKKKTAHHWKYLVSFHAQIFNHGFS